MEFRDTDSITPYSRNPRVNDQAVDAVAASIREFGFRQAIVIDAAGVIVVGHTRWKAAKKLGLAQVPVHVARDLTATQAKAYRIADNKTASLGTWDADLLPLELGDLKAADFDLTLIGFTECELDQLLQPAPVLGLTDPDAIPETPAKPITKPGDLWLLGDHRVLCGNATNLGSVESVRVDDCGLTVIDPEWDNPVRPADVAGDLLVFTDAGRIGQTIGWYGAPTWIFAWDCQACWYVSGQPLRRIKLALWYGRLENYNPDGAHYGPVADEKMVTNSRGRYRYKPDSRGLHLADLFCRQITSEHADGMHPHSKPVDWIRCLIGNCSTGSIFDPFLGSGTTLIAAEQLDRRCYGLEIEPRYCDVIVRRWEEFTGKKATREKGKH